MEKYNFTMQHLYGEDHQHITKILNILQASNIEESFIRKIYASIPMLNLSEAEYKLYAELAKNAFNFFMDRDPLKSKIKIYQGSSKYIISDHTVIEIVSDESPFLFDSTICLLNRLNIDVERVAHPNIFVRRDQKGNLLHIDEDLHDNGKKELFIQIRTSHSLDKPTIQKIEKELEEVLSLVKIAVDDWKSLVHDLQSYINKFNSYESFVDKDYQEQQEFLEKIKENYFVFLGSVQCYINSYEVSVIEDSVQGILKLQLDQFIPLFNRTIFSENFFKNKDNFISIGKLGKTSVIHREANLDYLCFKELDSEGDLIKIRLFVGLFTSILYYQSATLIPIIRGKLKYILNKSGFSHDSYAGKELISIVESLPRDELFQSSAELLFPILMEIYALLFHPELRLFLRKQGETVSCLLFLPLELANVSNIRKLKSALSFEYGPIVNHHFKQINNSRLCYYHFIIDSKLAKGSLADIDRVEQELRSITRPWDDNLYDLLLKEYGKNKGREFFYNFHQAFPVAYKEATIYSEEILDDIENSILSLKERDIVFKVAPVVEDKNNISLLKIYNIKELSLSAIMPMLQNMGFNVVAEQIYVIEPEGYEAEVYLHQFILSVDEKEFNMLSLAKDNIEDAFYAIWKERCQNDNYNQLILKSNLNHRQITFIRALAEYLYQIKIGYSNDYIGQVLSKHFEVAKYLVSLFYSMFNPKMLMEERKLKAKETREKLEELLSCIHDNIEDQILRKFMDLVNNILRTNYFIVDQYGENRDFISLKINSGSILDMPLPSPYREIFVYSASFEAIHLRGGKVSRGGLRWSDRLEDYRTEVLGLMKTQIVKNSVIVPTGAKGGFILKNITDLDRESLLTKAIDCYKNFLRGMLDITDNIVDGKVSYPKNVIRYDDSDTYLVVAADKGTATFSDIANQISNEYEYWLGDAFASGGSKGYDHKKMGITAKGGWISVTRHFYEMDIDIEKTEFTVIGIGDMSGDVFGNGMLLSQNIKLLAAFNHLHIFVDPNPDTKNSFAERSRLFNLPRSSWRDYNLKILSKGAQIYDRKAKTLRLTPEIKEKFKITIDELTPDSFIKILLTAEVDLLWNGGIGTYVKASFETHEQVGDKANDLLRCNASDLRCKIIGEGGNLGLTQYGRIEYARNGGRINTDAIDNSAGVDCSDHEVNIKIALHNAIKKGIISEVDRIELLERMTEEVSELVLKDNKTQTRALTIAEHQGYDILDSQEHFIDILEDLEILDRKIENLPSKQQFAQLHATKTSLTRPELSVLLAYSKNAIYNELIDSSLADEKYFYKDLLLYFPEKMREKFSEIIASHPLRKEIITSSITNSMVNRIDTFYLHSTVESTGHKFCDIARAYTVTRDLFNLRELWKEINALDGLVSVEHQVKLYIVIKKFVMRATNWLLRNYKNKIDIASSISEYQEKIQELLPIISDCAVGKFKDNYNTELEDFLAMDVPLELSKKISSLNLLSSAYNIVKVSNKYKVSVRRVAEIYFELGHRFNLDWLRHSANNLLWESNWQKLSITGFKEEIYDLNRKITSSAVDHAERHEGRLDKWYKQNDKHIKLFDKFITEIKSQGVIEYAMLDLSLKKLGALLTK